VSGVTLQGFAAVLVVLALVGVLAWLTRRGAFGALRANGRAISVETAVPLGERRSLVVVSVEGRRILLGLTPAQISLVTELAPRPGGPGPAFEQHLDSRS
jgi:flagellar protein FliO/FliZ